MLTPSAISSDAGRSRLGARGRAAERAWFSSLRSSSLAPPFLLSDGLALSMLESTVPRHAADDLRARPRSAHVVARPRRASVERQRALPLLLLDGGLSSPPIVSSWLPPPPPAVVVPPPPLLAAPRCERLTGVTLAGAHGPWEPRSLRPASVMVPVDAAGPISTALAARGPPNAARASGK